MRASEQTDKIALAYVAAWVELTNPGKDGKANYGRYTTLPALLDHVKGPLSRNGIAVMQEAVTTDLGVGCITRLVHTSGQFYEFGPLLFPGGDTPQKGGSAETYARRYQLSAAVGVAADDDDDGAKASDRTPEPTQARGSGPAGAERTHGTPPSSAPAPSVEAPLAGTEAGDKEHAAHSPAGVPGRVRLPGGEPPAPVASTSSSGPGEAHTTEATERPSTPGTEPAGAGAKGDGEAPEAPAPATPEQRTRLLRAYGGKPSAAKTKAMELFGYPRLGDVIISELTAAEVEALILSAARIEAAK